MWSYGVPDIALALQGATVLRFSSSLSRAMFLSTLERYLAVVTALHFENLKKTSCFKKTVTCFVTISALILLVGTYLPLCVVAVFTYALELTIQTLLPIVTFGRVSYTSLHRSFAQPFEVMDKTGLFPIQYIETEVIGEVDTYVYNACVRERQWRGFWPVFYAELDADEETALEAKLEPFVRAVSEASGMRSTIMKAGTSFVQIGGSRFRSKASIAKALGAEVDTIEHKMSCSLGRLYDPYNIFYRCNRVSLTDVASTGNSNVRAISDGQTCAKLVYRTSEYSNAFQELAEQIQDYPLTIDISRSDEIEVVRTNAVLLKHLIGIVGAIIAAVWFGFASIIKGKDVDKSAYVLGVYALWVNLGYIPILGKDSLSFTDIARVKRNRVIEALLHNKGYLGSEEKEGCWNYRKTRGSVNVGALSSEEAAVTARMCQTNNSTVIALDSCSLRSHTAVGTTSTHGVFQAVAWTLDRQNIDCSGRNSKMGST